MIKQSEKTMIQQSAAKTLHPENVLRQVNKVHRSKQSRDRRFALLVGAAVLAVMMLVAMVIESQLNLFSNTLRFGLTLLSLAATVVSTWTLWKRGKRNNERLVSAAKDIDATHPVLQQRVSTLTSCKEDQLESKQLVHPAMLNRLTEETETMHQRVEPKPIVSYRMLKLPLMCLAGAGLVLIGLFMWDTPKTLVQLGRFCAPWSNLSTTGVISVEADHVVARHEPLKLTASLSGRPVDEVVFLSKNVDGSDASTTRLWPSTEDNSVASVRQSKAIESFDYRFRAGDGQTNWHRVTVADRPKIQDLTMRIVPPDYTDRPARTFQQRLPKKLRVVVGSRLEVEVKPKFGVRTARLVMGKTDWLPMEPSSEGLYDGSLDLRRSVNFEVELTELHGLTNRRPPSCALQVVADQAPRVKILKPTKTTVLLPDETIDIHFKASDDFAIQKMALRVSTQREGEDEPTVHEVEIPIESESDRRRIKGSVALDLTQFDLKDGDTIRYEIRASDNFRPLEGVSTQTELHPMKELELGQAEAPLDANKVAAESASPTSQDPTSNNARGSSQVASPNSASAAQQSADKNAAASSDDVAQANPSSASETKSKQSPADQIADASSEDPAPDVASIENTIQATNLERDESAKDSASTAIAKSDPSMKQDRPANATKSSSSASSANASQNQSSQANQSQQANSSQNNNSGSSSTSESKPKLAANEDEQPDPAKADQDPTQSTADPVNMAMRSMDIGGGQSSSSGQQQIKVDTYAGGFTSEHRNKLELAISPTLELLKESLTRAGKSVREVMSDPTTGSGTDAALLSAAGELNVASESVIELNERTRNTPYAFVGLRFESVRAADVAPAWEEVRKAIDTQDEPRLEHSRTAWNHISRALASLAKLEEKYQQVKRDLKRADDIQKFKKMHRIFIEESLAMLNPPNPALNGQIRKGAEFDLDEEYLKRLKEVLELQRDMMAELARILADDPQLLRRYMNQLDKRTSSIRDQLTLVANDQKGLSLRVAHWSGAAQQPLELADHKAGALEMHLTEIEGVANRLADVQNEFVSWLPLVEGAEKGDVAGAVANFKSAGSELTEIVADVAAIYVEGGKQPDASRQIDPLLLKASKVENKLTSVALSLRQLNSNSTNPEIVNNAARRFPDLQTVQRDMQLWAGKLELLKDGLVHEAYSVDQENRRDQLLKYSVKIASLESQLVAALRNQDGQLPAGVAEKTQTLQKLLDADIPSAQLLAAQSLVDAEAESANLQQQEITQDFDTAEQTFDEILQAIADELDKLPPEDPIAALLRDPTLDEILAQLESEQDFLEQLGLNGRPTNLQFRSDWASSRPGGMSGAMAQLQRMRRLSNMAYRNALARARVKNEPRKPKLAKENLRWNLLVSELGEDMLQGDNKIPPERYRSAIKHYSEQISKLKNDQEENN